MRVRASLGILLGGCVIVFWSSKASAIGPTFGPPEVHDRFFLYDTEGRVGVIQTECDAPPWDQIATTVDIGGIVQIYLQTDLENPYSSYCGLNSDVVAPNQSSGTPYYVRRWHPDFGCISTFSYIGAQYGSGYPQFVMPVPFSQYDIPTRSDDAAPSDVGPSGHYVGLAIHFAQIADDPTTFTLAASAENFYDDISGDPQASILIEYLEGNARSGSVNWRPTFFSDQFSIFWSDFPASNDIKLQEGMPVPIGPVRVSFSFDGYTTDTILLDVEDLKNYYWTPMVGSAGGPTPSGFDPRAGIMDKGVADALLGDCEPSATLRAAFDPSSDGITDAADFTIPDSPSH